MTAILKSGCIYGVLPCLILSSCFNNAFDLVKSMCLILYIKLIKETIDGQ